MRTSDGYDLIIIGGGITGTMIAWDAALRGLKAALFEKKDFAIGTTGACTGFLHGGPRYISTGHPEVTEESCIESGILQRAAPHLCFRVPFITPALDEDPTLKGGPDYFCDMPQLEEFFAGYDKFAHYKNSEPHVKLTRDEVRMIEPGISDKVIGGVTFDEWGVDPFRLNLLTALAAARAGAEVRNHCEVVEILKDESGGRVIGVEVKDHRTGERSRFLGRYTVNAGGPWTSKVAALAGIEVRIRPTKGVHIIFDRRVCTAALVSHGVDGSFRELIPHETTTLMGCTDDDTFADPDHLVITEDDVEYLIDAAERLIPDIRKARVIRAMAGVRPMLYQWGCTEGKVSRDFKVLDHAERDGVDGFLTMAGGKMVTARFMAESLVDLVCDKLGRKLECRTREEFLPGGESTPDPALIAEEFELPIQFVDRIVKRHGALAARALEPVKSAPGLKRAICVCEPVTEVELRYAVREELAYTLDDLRRRLRLGNGPCQGAACIWQAAIVLADELGLGPEYARRQMVEFQQARWRGKFPVLEGGQVAQEELNQAYYSMSQC